MKPEKVKKRAKTTPPVLKNEKPKGGGILLGLFFNFGGMVMAALFLYIIFKNVQGYDWMLNTMLKGNLEQMDQNPNLSVSQKYELKWGGRVGYGEISYFNRVKEQTPDSAIIIVPPRKLLAQVGFKSAPELPWLSYFLYPRKVVYEDDKDSSRLYPKANYILAVNGWGLDKVNYRIDRPEAFMILPLKK